MKNSLLIAMILILICTQKFVAQENDSIIQKKKHPILTDKLYFNGGLFLPSKTIKIGLGGQSENDLIDFNEAFDFNQQESTFAGNFVWRFAKKWHLGTEYFGIKNSSRWAIDEEIEWDDVTYEVGASLEAGFRINMYRVFFGRLISSGQKHELGGGLGVHAMDIRTFIQGEGYVDDALEAGFERRTVDVTAPLPNIGFWYFYAPNDKWALTARVDWFGIKIGEYSGNLWNLAPGVKYQIWDHIGVGLNYRYFKTTLKVDKPNLDARLDLIFQGPLFTISGNF